MLEPRELHTWQGPGLPSPSYPLWRAEMTALPSKKRTKASRGGARHLIPSLALALRYHCAGFLFLPQPLASPLSLAAASASARISFPFSL